jgi:uncharacterized protein YecA (UPF0149 family)
VMAAQYAMPSCDDGCHDPPGAKPVTPSNRIGRNQPCPCGSGRKYKRCCMHGQSGE